jgi:hypothetical protein
MFHVHYKLLKWLTLYSEVIALECGHHMKRIKTLCRQSARVIAQNSIEVDAKTKESMGKTEEELDGRNKEGHERKKPKGRPVGR